MADGEEDEEEERGEAVLEKQVSCSLYTPEAKAKPMLCKDDDSLLWLKW